MSYDYTLLRLKGRVESPATMDAADVAPIGSYDEIKAAASAAFADVAWSDAEKAGLIREGVRWVELRVFHASGLQSVAVRTSLRHDSSDLVERLCDALRLTAFDAQAMRMYQPADPEGVGRHGRGWVPFC
jgi:hypothetical protein